LQILAKGKIHKQMRTLTFLVAFLQSEEHSGRLGRKLSVYQEAAKIASGLFNTKYCTRWAFGTSNRDQIEIAMLKSYGRILQKVNLVIVNYFDNFALNLKS